MFYMHYDAVCNRTPSTSLSVHSWQPAGSTPGFEMGSTSEVWSLFSWPGSKQLSCRIVHCRGTFPSTSCFMLICFRTILYLLFWKVAIECYRASQADTAASPGQVESLGKSNSAFVLPARLPGLPGNGWSCKMLHGVAEALARHHPEQSCWARGPWVCQSSCWSFSVLPANNTCVRGKCNTKM